MASTEVAPAASRPLHAGWRPAVLTSRPFLLIWLGLSVSLLGDHFYRVGLTWTTTALGGLGDAVVLGAIMALPSALFGLVGGAIVDRSNHVGVLIGSDVVRAVIMGVVTGVVVSPLPHVPLLLGGAFLLSSASVMFMPAFQTLLPVIAGGDRERIIAMDAWVIGTVNVMNIAGPALAGVLLATIDTSWLFGFDAASFLFSALMLALMGRVLPPLELPADRPKRTPGGVLRGARQGLVFLRRHDVLRPQFSTFPFMEGSVYALVFVLPAFVDAHLGGGSAAYGAVIAANAVGRVAGLTLITRTPLKRRRGVIFAGNFVVQGTAVLLLAFSGRLWLAALASVVMGLPAGAAQVAMSSYIQMELPPELRGRVFGALSSVIMWLIPIAPVVFGSIALQWSSATAVTAIGATLVAGGLFIASHRAVRSVR